MKAQFRAYGDSVKERWPNAYLASEEAVEDAIQRAGSRGPCSSVNKRRTGRDPVELEESLAQACWMPLSFL